jgi:predicted transcriptional regulator
VRTIIRTDHDKDNPYVKVSKVTVRDDSLSFEDRGFLQYLLSFPDDWRIRPDQISKDNGKHISTVYRLIQRLIVRGYIRKCKVARRKDDGGFESVCLYQVYETKVKYEEVPF